MAGASAPHAACSRRTCLCIAANCTILQVRKEGSRTGDGADIGETHEQKPVDAAKAVLDKVADAVYFEVQAEAGRIVLIPVRINRIDAVRKKLAELGITEDDLKDAASAGQSKSRCWPNTCPFAKLPCLPTPPRCRQCGMLLTASSCS